MGVDLVAATLTTSAGAGRDALLELGGDGRARQEAHVLASTDHLVRAEVDARGCPGPRSGTTVASGTARCASPRRRRPSPRPAGRGRRARKPDLVVLDARCSGAVDEQDAHRGRYEHDQRALVSSIVEAVALVSRLHHVRLAGVGELTIGNTVA